MKQPAPKSPRSRAAMQRSDLFVLAGFGLGLVGLFTVLLTLSPARTNRKPPRPLPEAEPNTFEESLAGIRGRLEEAGRELDAVEQGLGGERPGPGMLRAYRTKLEVLQQDLASRKPPLDHMLGLMKARKEKARPKPEQVRRTLASLENHLRRTEALLNRVRRLTGSRQDRR